jgi:hypothetical protein
MGIRPGVTTVEEAIAILEAHEWVASVNIVPWSDGRGISAVRWSWSPNKPIFVDDTYEGMLWVSINSIQDISIVTHSQLGEFWQLFDVPLEFHVFGDRETGIPSAGFYALYPGNLVVSTFEPCPFKFIWQAQTVISWDNDPSWMDRNFFSDNEPPTGIFGVCQRLRSS